MLFNSLDFAVFFPVVMAVYWLLSRRSIVSQNAFLVLASYYFYSVWDWRFLSLIVVSSAIDYVVGIAMLRWEMGWQRRMALGISLAANLGMLGFFKYYHFFVESFRESFLWFGVSIDSSSLSIILPAGISFYTFQTLSYSMDIYRRRIPVCRDPIAFFAFVSFFPQLVAGPIERAGHLLPQFQSQRRLVPDDVRQGLRQFLWGLFKKVVIADNCGRYVDQIFGNYETLPASALWVGAILFAFQIYGDFAGYSDMAIGSARLLGFRLSQNFNNPYLACGLSDFWRRWHITLSTWFRDYVYVPLGGRADRGAVMARNIFIVFLLSGLWHGAAWTFVLWGGYHAIGLIVWSKILSPLRIAKKTPARDDVRGLGAWLLVPPTFLYVCLGWVLFRSPTVADAYGYSARMFDTSIGSPTDLFPIRVMGLIALMMALEFYHRDRQHGLDFDTQRVPKLIRWTVYQSLVFGILSFGVPDQSFIYFRF